jgi:non-homologous end joining protein Ku
MTYRYILQRATECKVRNGHASDARTRKVPGDIASSRSAGRHNRSSQPVRLIEPMGSGLRGITLRYAHEIRSETEYFADIPKMNLPDEMLRITEHILETKKEDFDPAFLEDRYRTVLVEKLREKQARMPARPVASVPSQENVINLLDALKRSLAAEQPARRTARAAKSTIRRARSRCHFEEARRSK